MKDKISRRGFFGSGALIGLAANLFPRSSFASQTQSSKPVVVSSSNGFYATQMAMALIKRGADTLDAAIAGVKIVEDDPKDRSVGYGGLPNEEGVVELDACVMHGPTRRAGAVASLRDIKNPASVAKVVMERTDHLLLVGEGALRFALAHGFKRENLLTDESREIWLRWKERMSNRDAWGPGLDSPETKLSALSNKREAELETMARAYITRPPTGTITCLVVNDKGDISGTTTTSGLAFKIPGRVGDSPLIGCGLYVDNDIGAAGATGKGEECIKVNGAHTIVEMMRRGMSPTDACLEALKRIARNHNNDMAKLRRIGMDFYAVNKQGQHGGASLWSHDESATDQGVKLSRPQYAVNDGNENKLVDSAFLLERKS
jgi:N4-(beta-N-acetylglucosaminyl)-L-asparaginase